jgi:hypothetical protein
MAVDPDSLRPLLPSARVELARQINNGVGDAAALVAESGWSWNLAYALARAINGEGSNVEALRHEGIPAQAARAIAEACTEAFEAREARAAAVKAEAARVAVRGYRARNGAARGAVKFREVGL